MPSFCSSAKYVFLPLANNLHLSACHKLPLHTIHICPLIICYTQKNLCFVLGHRGTEAILFQTAWQPPLSAQFFWGVTRSHICRLWFKCHLYSTLLLRKWQNFRTSVSLITWQTIKLWRKKKTKKTWRHCLGTWNCSLLNPHLQWQFLKMF